MPFSARLGFYGETGPPEPDTPWYELSNTEISAAISSFDLIGTRSSSSFDLGSTIYSTNGAYRGAVAAPNGNVYLAPSAKSTSNILEYDPSTGNATEIDSGETLSGPLRYLNGALANNNKIYWAPYNMDKFLIYDVDAGSFELQDWGLTLSNPGYEFIKAAGDKLYCIGTPANAVIINVSANTATESTLNVSLGGPTFAKFVSGTRSVADNCIYAAPYNKTQVLKIDPTTDEGTLTNYGETISAQASQGITNGKNGNLYITSHNATRVYEIDPIANVMTTISTTGTTTMGAAMGTDGNVYGGAFDQGMFINVDTSSVTNNPSYIPSGEQRWGAVSQGSTLLMFPAQTSNTHVYHIDTAGSGTSSSILNEITWSNYFNGSR